MGKRWLVLTIAGVSLVAAFYVGWIRNTGDGNFGPAVSEYVLWETPEAEAATGHNINITLLARVIEGEAGGEPFIGKVAVGAVILNRIRDARFPNTLSGVVFQPLAFESVANGRIWEPVSQESYRAARLALAGWDPTHNALYFWNPAKRVSRWIWTRTIFTQIGKHVFGR